jgi:predicted DNA-binding protein
MKRNTTKFTFRTDPDVKKKLNRLAKDNNRSASDYLRLLIEFADRNNLGL